MNTGILPSTNGMLYAYRIWIDPRQPDVVFAGTFAGLARSSDGGATWHTDPSLTEYYLSGGMAFDPNTPGLVYLASTAGLTVSTDDGLTWQPLPSPDSTYFLPSSIVIDPRNSHTLYTSSNYGGVFRSTDSGNTWTRQYSLVTGVSALVADAAGTLYAGAGSRLLMSTDGFNTYTTVGPAVAGINSLLVAGSRLFVGTQLSTDVYVAKFDPLGNVIYATYFGGSSTDEARAMTVDASGAVYVTGSTYSLDFPVTAGAYATSGNSFVFKLNPDGSLAYSTYFTATPNAIAVDSGGHAFIAGLTYGNLPVTDGAYQTKLQGSYPCCNILGPGPPPVTNAFLTAFDAAGASLLFSTYIGSFTELADTLALTPEGDAILAGAGKLYRMKGDGSALLQTSTVPGTVWSVVVDAGGTIYAGGQTNAGGPAFPTTAGAYQVAPPSVPSLPGTMGNAGGGHAFVTRFDSQFNILASTLLAGEAADSTLALAIGANGSILAGGSTNSKEFPLRGPAQGSFAAATGFVAELKPDLSDLVFSTFAGDTRMFNVRSITPSADGGVLFAGATTGSPYYSPYGSFDQLFPGGPACQTFVVKAGVQAVAPRIDAVVNAASLLGVPLSPGETFQVLGDGFGTDAALLLNGTAVPLIARSRTSLTAMFPADFVTPGAATIVVQSGNNSSSFLAPVADRAPGVFSVDGSGLGQGYILNQDGTLNSPANPAKEGSPVTIFATGVGPMTFDRGYAVTNSPVDVYIDGFYSDGIAAVLGPVSSLPGNVYQISVYVPRPSDYVDQNPNLKNFVMPPFVAVTLEAAGAKSQAGLGISVTQ